MPGMGRRRTIHLNLPIHMKARVRPSGTYFYYFDGKKEIPLGSDYVAAVQKWAKLEGGNARVADIVTVRYIAEKYFAGEQFKKLAARTQKDYLADITNLYKFFDDPPAPLDQIQRHTIAQYRDWRKVTHSTQELAVMSVIWNWASEQGYTDLPNPCNRVKRNRSKGRDVYVDDALFNKVYNKADQPTRDAMDLAHLAGQRPGDSLKFKEGDIRDGELWIRQGKTGTPLRVAIVGKLKEVIDRIMARKASLKGKVRSIALVVNEKGQALSRSALDNRFEDARRAAGVDLNSFQFRDLRAKAATEVNEESGEVAAQGLLGHKDVKMTKHYIRNRKGKLVQPTR